MNKSKKPVPVKNPVPAKKPGEYITVNITIRADLVDHWGGLVIPGFIKDDDGKINVSGLVVPGFAYRIDEGKDTFTVTTDHVGVKK